MAVSIDFKKKVQIINFFAKQVLGKEIGKIEVLKAVFFADRYHILKYCRSVSGDTYYAMKHGPVASEIKNICNLDHERLTTEEIDYASLFLDVKKDSVHSVSTREYDADVFSETDMEALGKSLELILRLKNDKVDIAEYSHRFFKWDEKYAPFLPKSENNRIDLDVDEFFDIVEDDYCAEIPEDVRFFNREMINIY